MRGKATAFFVVLVGASIVWSACGGGVVAGPPGGGGADGGTDGAAGKGKGGSGGTYPDCDSIKANLDAKFAAAIVCNPAVSSIQCSKNLMVPDSCGCNVAANQNTIDAATAAGKAYVDWKNSGCAYACGQPCQDVQSWYCMPSEDGTTGSCAPSP
jgi:hypothetical protein